VPGGHEFIALSDGSVPCGLDASGDLYCWSMDDLQPSLASGGNDITAFSGRFGGNVCAIAGGFAYCLGPDDRGQLGNVGSTSSTEDFTPVFPPNVPGTPGTVTDLRIAARTPASITLAWTEVDDGTGNPAWYRVKYATPPIDYPSATVGCSRTIRGDGIGSDISCTIEDLSPVTEYDFQLAAFRSEDGVWVASTFSGIVTGSTSSRGVNDLRVAERDLGHTVVRWTQIDDGTGSPANYRVKHASQITNWKEATTMCTKAGTAVGETITCGFQSEDFYDEDEPFEVQLMSYRVDANGVWRDALYSNLLFVPGGQILED
jgi:hypothetical protein